MSLPVGLPESGFCASLHTREVVAGVLGAALSSVGPGNITTTPRTSVPLETCTCA